MRKRDGLYLFATCTWLLAAGAGCIGAEEVDPPPMQEPEPDPDPDPPGGPGVWGTARAIHDLPGSSQLAVLRLDDAGNAVALWQQAHPTAPYGLWAARRIGMQWEAATPVAADSRVGSDLSIAGDTLGAHVTWLKSDGNDRYIVSTQVQSDGTWSTLTTHRQSSWQQGVLLQPRVAADTDHAALVWAFQDPTTRTFVLEGRIRAAGGAWSPIPAVASGITIASYSRPLYDLSFDAAGDLVVTWVEHTTDSVEVWARRGSPLEGSLTIAWEAARRVAMVSNQPNSYPMRELWTGMHAGRSFAAFMWAEPDGSLSIGASHLRPDGTWDAEPTTTGIVSSHYALPRFAAGAGGDKVVVWREPLVESSRVVARRYDRDHGWQPTVIVQDGLEAPYIGCIDIDAHFFDVAVDGDGNAIALWEERLDEKVNGRSRLAIFSSQFVAGTGWEPSVRIDRGDTQPGVPQAALGAGNLGIALFRSETGDGKAALEVNQLAPATE